jgi:hypothetical protein
VIDGLERGGKRRGIAVVPAQVLRMFVLFMQLNQRIVVDPTLGLANATIDWGNAAPTFGGSGDWGKDRGRAL